MLDSETAWKQTPDNSELQQLADALGYICMYANIKVGRKGEALETTEYDDNGDRTAQRYIEEVLLDAVIPFSLFIVERFILMQDNARTYRERNVTEYLNQVGTTLSDWPTDIDINHLIVIAILLLLT